MRSMLQDQNIYIQRLQHITSYYHTKFYTNIYIKRLCTPSKNKNNGIRKNIGLVSFLHNNLVKEF